MGKMKTAVQKMNHMKSATPKINYVKNTRFNDKSTNKLSEAKKEFSLNSMLKNNVVEACKTLKMKVSENEVKDLKKLAESFKDIFNGNVSVSTSYKNLENNHTIPRFDFDIEEAFYTIGLELRSPENGTTNLLREAYKIDVPNSDKPFIDYQYATIEETYNLLESHLIGNDEISKL